MDQPIVRFVGQSPEKHIGDCSVASLAMLLGITYSEALVAIARVAPDVLKQGANWAQLKKAARSRKVTLTEQRAFSLEDDSEDAGILGVEFSDGTQHAVYFKRGLIFDGRTGNVWDADVYLHQENAKPLSMLVRKG